MLTKASNDQCTFYRDSRCWWSMLTLDRIEGRLWKLNIWGLRSLKISAEQRYF